MRAEGVRSLSGRLLYTFDLCPLYPVFRHFGQVLADLRVGAFFGELQEAFSFLATELSLSSFHPVPPGRLVTACSGWARLSVASLNPVLRHRYQSLSEFGVAALLRQFQQALRMFRKEQIFHLDALPHATAHNRRWF